MLQALERDVDELELATVEEGEQIVTPHVSKPYDYVNHMFMRP
jgi:hypothetical protein